MMQPVRSLWRVLRRRERFEAQMDEELRFHLESRIADLERRGLDRREARRQARLEFGNPSAWHERCREARGLRLLDDFVADVRFALRGFRRQKLLTLVVIATLTFGIGVSSGVFTVLASIALRPMIDRSVDADSFFRVYATSSTEKALQKPFGPLNVEEYLTFRDAARTVRTMSAQSRFSAPFGDDEAATSMNFVSCNFFEVYGATHAVVGRLLQPADCDDAAPVIVLTHTLWRSRFGGDEQIVGRVLTVRGTALTVVGVAPPMASGIGLAFASIPYTLRGRLRLGDDPRRMKDGHYPHDRWLQVMGRLAPGATREQATAELGVIAGRLDRLHPGATSAALVTDGAIIHDPLSAAPAKSMVGLIMGALTCLVLIACANVATLLLSRADARQQEVAVRLSLGAGRGRLLRMLLTETLTLAALAGAGSLYIAYTLPRALVNWLTGTSPELTFTPDWRVFTYLGATVCIAGVAAGLAPALESMRADILEALKGRRATLAPAMGASRFRSVLVAVQVGLSFVLLVGASLFLITHYATVHREVGMETAHVLVPAIAYRAAGAPATAPPVADVRATLEGVPGVRSVVFAAASPIGANQKVEIGSLESGWRSVAIHRVSPGFFEALDLPIVRGRAIDESDRPCGTEPCQAVVSETFAAQVLHTADPIGAVLQTRAGWTVRVVGVSRDTTVQRFNTPDPPQIYVPWSPGGDYQALVRVAGEVAQAAPAVTAALATRFPGTALNVTTLRAPIEGWVEDVGRLETLIVTLGGTAVALAALGIFGVVSFAVSRRRHELGVRLALGAARRDIYSTVASGAVFPVAAGLVAGVGLALAAAVLFARLLYELRFAVSARDPLTYAATAAVLLSIVTVAVFVPARRAASINPLVALRYE